MSNLNDLPRQNSEMVQNGIVTRAWYNFFRRLVADVTTVTNTAIASNPYQSLPSADGQVLKQTDGLLQFDFLKAFEVKFTPAGSISSTDMESVIGEIDGDLNAIDSLISALQTEKADLDSPAFTNTPTAPTAAVDTNTAQLATTAFVIAQGYAKNTANVQTVTSSATVTAVSTNNLVVVTAQNVGLTLANPTGTFTEGQKLTYRIKDNATPQTIAFGTNFRAIGLTLPSITIASKTLYIYTEYNAIDSKHDVVRIAQE